ncbi:MAG TPA: DUF308 domain-containing protein [Chloroflexota bacterium]|jgi:uncharacterized membrane protein HdeD (DUF308 family)
MASTSPQPVGGQAQAPGIVTDAGRARETWLWWLPVAFGISAIVLGVLLLTFPAMTALVLVAVMGVYWLVEGVFDVILAVVHRAPRWGWRLASGIISALAGLFILAYPITGTLLTVVLLFWVLVIGAIVSGILDIIHGVQAASRSWWTVALGAVKILLALLLMEDPLVGTLTLVPALGLLAIVNGIVAIVWAARFRGHLQAAPTA